jgi:hypothetical protein
MEGQLQYLGGLLRLEAVAHGFTRFVGWPTELPALHRALELVGAGHGQVVALLSEAGMSKSRLVYEVVHSHRTQGWRVLESASVSYGTASWRRPNRRPTPSHRCDPSHATAIEALFCAVQRITSRCLRLRRHGHITAIRTIASPSR